MFYELIYGIRNYHVLWRFKKELKLLDIDSSFIKLNRDFFKIEILLFNKKH